MEPEKEKSSRGGRNYLSVTLERILPLMLQSPLNRYGSLVCLETFCPLMASFLMLLTSSNIFMEGGTGFLEEQILTK